MFLLEMARRRKDHNFLGLEINEKVFFLVIISINLNHIHYLTLVRPFQLVKRCLHSVHQLEMKNG